jgi:hypothetical protein
MIDLKVQLLKNQISGIEKQMEEYLKSKRDTSSKLTIGPYKVDLCIPRQNNNISNWTDDHCIWGASVITIGGLYEISGDMLRTIIRQHEELMTTLPSGHVTRATPIKIGHVECSLKDLYEVMYRLKKEHEFIKNSVGHDERDHFRKEIFSTEGKKLK